MIKECDVFEAFLDFGTMGNTLGYVVGVSSLEDKFLVVNGKFNFTIEDGPPLRFVSMSWDVNILGEFHEDDLLGFTLE